jgi:hypothetical protein
MGRKTGEERLAELRTREAQIAAQRKALEARAASDSRRRDTRARCVLAGAFIALLRGEEEVRAGLCRAVLARCEARDRVLVAGLLVRALDGGAPAVAVAHAGEGR